MADNGFRTVSIKLHNLKSNLQYTSVITPKHVPSGETYLRGLKPEQHSSKKRRSDGEPLAPLRPI